MRNKIVFVLLACSLSVNAQVKLQPLFTDNMVLQQQADAPIWGEDKPGKTIKVVPSWNNKTYTTTADRHGRWMVKVETPMAGGPYDIRISDGKTITLKNVLIGEVWLCSGQSNMEMPVEGWGKVNNYQAETAEAQNHPNIRLLQLKMVSAMKPTDRFAAVADGWQVCSSAAIKEFSSTAYFFGREIEKYRHVPIGLIQSCWGGSSGEAWASGEALATFPDYRDNVNELLKIPTGEKQQQEYIDKRRKEWELQGFDTDKGFENRVPVWAATNFDDSQWAKTTVPNRADDAEMAGFDGVIWMRFEMSIPQRWAGKDLQLNLGTVDDNDITYFNGTPIGSTNGYEVPRSYTVPGTLVKGGKAVITVRVTDMDGGAGIFGTTEPQDIGPSKDDRLPLTGEWRLAKSTPLGKLPAIPIVMAPENQIPMVVFNAMINPLIPYRIKGALWYQGETNVYKAYQYRSLLPLLMNDWRTRWGYSFPFYIAQLANFMDREEQPSETTWGELREAQLQALSMEHTGMAVLIDIGEAKDIHPKNKQEVGRRLGLLARALTYGEKIPYSGPIYSSYRMEGNKIRIFFDHTDNGLKAVGDELKGFSMAGVDRKFHWAKAMIDGNSVVVECPEVAFPIAVRYAWGNNPECNLYNGAGLPASPFRTDQWNGLTYGCK
ncbi:MAG TPA: sialate O-acetylesterase [Prevotella sp.]